MLQALHEMPAAGLPKYPLSHLLLWTHVSLGDDNDVISRAEDGDKSKDSDRASHLLQVLPSSLDVSPGHSMCIYRGE